MRNEKQNKELRLLPVYFKKIGLLVIVLAFMPLAIAMLKDMRLPQDHKNLLRIFTFNMLILGLLFIACSRDKVEDEMMFAFRLKAMSLALLFTIVHVLVAPLLGLIFNDLPFTLTAQQTVMSMLTMYLISYKMLKAKG